MGKSYIENSLKRFLKRKVKITLGLVVTFMITGAVSFGAEINDIPKGYEDRVFIEKNEYIIKKGTEFNDFFEIKVNGLNLSEQAAIFAFNGAIVKNYGDVNITPKTNNPNARAVYISDNSIFENHGNLNLKVTVNNNSSFYNYGKIDCSQYGRYTVYVENNSLFENYGFISGKHNILTIRGNSIVKNYGRIDLIGNNLINEDFDRVGTFENYGIITNQEYLPFGDFGKNLQYTNKGIFLLKGKNISNLGFIDNKGAVLIKENDKYTLLNGENSEAKIKIKDMSQETEINSKNSADNIFINNNSLTLNLGDKVTGKTITALSQKKEI